MREEEFAEVARPAGCAAKGQAPRRELDEANPMLGHRGCRLGDHLSGNLRNAGPRHFRGRGTVTKNRHDVVPEVMIPLVATSRNSNLKDVIDRGGQAVGGRRPERMPYLVGTMIELPRAACAPARLPRPPSSSASAPTI